MCWLQAFLNSDFSQLSLLLYNCGNVFACNVSCSESLFVLETYFGYWQMNVEQAKMNLDVFSTLTLIFTG